MERTDLVEEEIMILERAPSTLQEIAHVLSVDIVDYARLPLDQQRQMLAELQAVVRAAVAACCPGAGCDAREMPMSDGMVLVFFRDLLAPVECALHAARALQS